MLSSTESDDSKMEYPCENSIEQTTMHNLSNSEIESSSEYKPDSGSSSKCSDSGSSSKYSDSGSEYSEESYSDISYVQNISKRRWWAGIKAFHQLNNKHTVLNALTYIWPLVLFVNNIIAISYITNVKMIWFWFIIPTITTYFLYYMQKTLLFAPTPTISTTILSYYPGKHYKYGLLFARECYTMHLFHGREDTYDEYWVVYNEHNNDINLLIVEDHDYDEPHHVYV